MEALSLLFGESFVQILRSESIPHNLSIKELTLWIHCLSHKLKLLTIKENGLSELVYFFMNVNLF